MGIVECKIPGRYRDKEGRERRGEIRRERGLGGCGMQNSRKAPHIEKRHRHIGRKKGDKEKREKEERNRRGREGGRQRREQRGKEGREKEKRERERRKKGGHKGGPSPCWRQNKIGGVDKQHSSLQGACAVVVAW